VAKPIKGRGGAKGDPKNMKKPVQRKGGLCDLQWVLEVKGMLGSLSSNSERPMRGSLIRKEDKRLGVGN